MAAAFEQMAQNEMMHARFWFELLYGKPTDTKECLTQAAMGEYGEWHDMYPDFAAQARAEGLEDIAVMFEKVAAIERRKPATAVSSAARCLRSGPTSVIPARPLGPLSWWTTTNKNVRPRQFLNCRG